jgi:hypothetical protein
MSRYGSDAEVSGSIEVSGSAIFNEGSLDADFRVESDSNTHMLYVDAGNSRVGIGTDSPDYELDVAGNIGVDQYIYHNDDADTFMRFGDNAVTLKAGGLSFINLDKKGSAPHELTFNDGSNNIDFIVKGNGSNEGNPLFKCDASTGRVGINGVGSPECELHVDGDVKIAASSGDTSLIVEGTQDVTLGLVADTDNSGGEDQNPSLYMSQETSTAGAYQFLMGLEGTANLSYTGSYTNQPFILSLNSETHTSLRTFQIATADGGDVSSRFSIATGGRIAIGDAVQAADARLHVKEAAGDIFKMENTTAYAVTYGQLVKENLTLADGGSPLDTTLDLPARSMITDVLITIKTPGVGTSHNLENVALTANSQTNNIKGSSFPSGLSLISNPGQGVAAGTQYVLGNTDQSFPAGRATMLLPSAADIKLVYSDDGISTEPIVDVVVFYKKYDAS